MPWQTGETTGYLRTLLHRRSKTSRAVTRGPFERLPRKPKGRVAQAIALILISGLTGQQARAGTLPLPVHVLKNARVTGLGPRPRFLLSCAVSAPNMNFGTYNIFSPAPLAASTTVSITCGYLLGGGAITVSLSPGASGSYTTRTLSDGTDTLDYNLYADPAHTQIFGDGSGGTYTYRTTLRGGFFGTVQSSFTIYGLIPAQQNVSAGAYTDTVVLSLNY